MAPWAKTHTVAMEDLYSNPELETGENTPTGVTTHRIEDYKELFNSPATDGKAKRILVKGDPGIGKTTFVKKVAWDWAKRILTAVSVVFFISMKLVRPGDTIENMIIQQTPVLEGCHVTESRLRNILEKFGFRCLIIFDGYDECKDSSGNYGNEDVVRLLRGQKFLRCNVLLTSRPHITADIEHYFCPIVTAKGFGEESAERFASKILVQNSKLRQVLDFECFQSEGFRYGDCKCPVLLLFVCILVNHNAIDLSRKDITMGEIYTRLVRCLYRKFVNRRGLNITSGGFVGVLKDVGKVAWNTLISDNLLVQRSEIIRDAGDDAFDYGFLIGYEDHQLSANETADIMVTFPHRTIQEFLGSFYLIQMLSEGKPVRTLLGKYSEDPIFMTNPMFLHFCLWLIYESSPLLSFDEIGSVFEALQSFILEKVDVVQLDLDTIRGRYHAINIQHPANDLCRRFYAELLKKMKKAKDWMLCSKTNVVEESWMFKHLGQSIEALNSVFLAHCYLLDLSAFWSSSREISVVLAHNFSGPEVLQLFQSNELSSKRLSLYVIFAKDVSLFYNRKFQRFWLQNFGAISESLPLLARLALVNADCFLPLQEAVKAGKLTNLSHLSVRKSDLRNKLGYVFGATWTKLTELDLYFCAFTVLDLEALCRAVQEPNGTLPNLLLLRISLFHVYHEQRDLDEIAVETLFKTPWPKLNGLSIGLLGKQCPQFVQSLKTKKLPRLKRLSFALKVLGLHEDFVKEVTPFPETLTLEHFVIQSSLTGLAQSLTLGKLNKLALRRGSGITGKLSELLSQKFIHLSTLSVSDCDLDPEDVRSLARANLAGRLPELKHLDVSGNAGVRGNLSCLFENSCTWDQLLSLDITHYAGIVDSTDVKVLYSKVGSGCLGSLRELGFTTDSTSLSEVYNQVEWRHLAKLKLFTNDAESSPCEDDFAGTLALIADAVDERRYPVLNTVTVFFCSHLVNLRYRPQQIHRLRKANIKVYTCSNPAEAQSGLMHEHGLLTGNRLFEFE